MKLDLEKAGAGVTPCAELKPEAQLSAVEELEKAQHPLKKDQPAEMLDPRVIALMNSQTSAAVAEAIKPFLGLIDQLSQPQREAFEKGKQIQERNKREWARERQQMQETRRAEKIKRENCSHLDGNGHSKINVIHNFPDHQPRGVCFACGLWIHPKEYRTCVPSVETVEQAQEFIRELERQGEPAGITPYVDPATHKVSHLLYPAHPLYGFVQQLEQRNQMGVI